MAASRRSHAILRPQRPRDTKFRNEKQKMSRAKVECRKSIIRIAIRIASYQCLKRPCNRTILNRSILDSEYPIQCHYPDLLFLVFLDFLAFFAFQGPPRFC